MCIFEIHTLCDYWHETILSYACKPDYIDDQVGENVPTFDDIFDFVYVICSCTNVVVSDNGH